MITTAHLLKFDDMPFEEIQEGLEQKRITRDNRVIRILRISPPFTEKNWCTNGHIGYVLSGSMKLDFNGKVERYNQGDGLWIEPGETSKHKVSIEAGEQVLLLLFESVA